MSCMSGSPNLNSFRDRGQVAVQLVSCGVLLPGLVQDLLIIFTKFYMISSNYFHFRIIICLRTVIWFQVTNNNPYRQL